MSHSLRKEKVCIYYIYNSDTIPDKESPIVLLYNIHILVEELEKQVEKYRRIIEKENTILEELSTLRKSLGLEASSLEDLFNKIDEKYRLAREALLERLRSYERKHVVDVEDRSGKYPRYRKNSENGRRKK